MEKKKRILLDCDGVLADWAGYLLKKLDCGLTVDDIYDFKIRLVLKELRGNAMAKRSSVICSTTSFVSSQPKLAWADELVSLSRSLGDVIVLTSPWQSVGWYDARIQWLKGLGFKQDDVIVGRAKSWVAAVLFVDDKPANIIDWAVDNPSGRAVLLAWPCNVKHDPLPLNARRLSPDELLTQLRIGAPTW